MAGRWRGRNEQLTEATGTIEDTIQNIEHKAWYLIKALDDIVDKAVGLKDQLEDIVDGSNGNFGKKED